MTHNQETQSERTTQALASALTRRIVQQIGQQLASRAATRGLLALLFKAGGAFSAKVVAVIVLVIMIIALAGGLLLAMLGAIGSAFQQTTSVWPVPVDIREDGSYRAGGWAISSRYGWRANTVTGQAEFHDGLDIVNPSGGCPFGERCALPAMFDGVVEYVGWDQSGAGDPLSAGGGQIVILENGAEDHKTLYAHLQPYRLHVQLQGRIKDDYGRYDDYADYQPIGQGELMPDLGDGAIEMWCALDMPGFRPTRTGPGSVTFVYDRPAQCRTSVIWGERQDDWQGWIADQPAADQQGRATLAWQTGIDSGRYASDVALRFRAHLVPPPPPPTALPTPTAGVPGSKPEPGNRAPVGTSAVYASEAFRDRAFTPGSMVPAGQGGLGGGWYQPGTRMATGTSQPRQCERQGNGWRCIWGLADIPIAAEQSELDTGQVSDGMGSMAAYTALFQQAVPSSTPLGGLTSTPAVVPTAVTSPALAVSIVASQEKVPIGGRFSVSVGVWNDGAEAVSIPVSVQTGDGVIVLHSSASGNGTCTYSANTASCIVRPRTAAPATVAVTFEVLPGAAALRSVNITASAETETQHQSDAIQIEIAQYAVTPGPWPPPTMAPTAVPTMTPVVPVSPWPTIDPDATALPTKLPTPVPPGQGPGDPAQNCAPQTLVQLPGVVNAAGQTHNIRLIAPAAAHFQEARAEILAATGQDPLAHLADVLRAPEFRSSKPGVARMSWHMTGRAIDLDTGYGWRRVREGRYWRLYLGQTDITALFEAHGFQRIPDRDDSTEWWHYEYRPDRLDWASSMLQVWPITRLQAAFPEIAWASVGCQVDQGTNPIIEPIAQGLDMCVAGTPSYQAAVEELPGCGPPVRAGDRVFQLSSTLGFVGVTGQTTGPHLHLGLMVKSYDGMYHQVNICTPEWLQGRILPQNANCWTDMADPLAFLPLAPPPSQASKQQQNAAHTPTAIIPEGAPWQLPPPDYPGSLLHEPGPEATPSGQYWSPYQDGGQYGGGGVGEWFVETTCRTWNQFSWCPRP